MKKWLSLVGALAAAAAVLGGGWFWLSSASQMMRIRALMGGVSIGVLVITLLAIRSYKLREKYAVLWLTTAALITMVALFPQIVDAVREWFGMQYVTTMVTVVFVFLVLVSFHFSIALSSLNDKAAAMASRVAILEARIQELESGRGSAGQAEEKQTSSSPSRRDCL